MGHLYNGELLVITRGLVFQETWGFSSPRCPDLLRFLRCLILRYEDDRLGSHFNSASQTIQTWEFLHFFLCSSYALDNVAVFFFYSVLTVFWRDVADAHFQSTLWCGPLTTGENLHCARVIQCWIMMIDVYWLLWRFSLSKYTHFFCVMKAAAVSPISTGFLWFKYLHIIYIRSSNRNHMKSYQIIWTQIKSNQISRSSPSCEFFRFFVGLLRESPHLIAVRLRSSFEACKLGGCGCGWGLTCGRSRKIWILQSRDMVYMKI